MCETRPLGTFALNGNKQEAVVVTLIVSGRADTPGPNLICRCERPRAVRRNPRPDTYLRRFVILDRNDSRARRCVRDVEHREITRVG